MYTIKEAAARTGLGVSLIRAWERRYGVVDPQRTPSGYRLYDDNALEALRAMRRLVEDGWSPSEAARALIAGTAPVSDRLAASGSPIEGAVSLVERFVAAAAALDARGVETVLDEILARGSFESIVDALLLPAAAALGDAWAAGRLDAGAEHAASAAVHRRLAAAFQAAGRPSGLPVLVGLPPASRHELGALAFATALRRRGIDVLYLGADVPETSWAEAAARSTSPMAVLAVVTAEDRVPAALVATKLLLNRPAMLVGLGGAAAEEVPIDDSRAVRLPQPVTEAAAAVSDLLGGRAATIP